MYYIIHGLLEDAADNSRPREELIQCEIQIVSHRAWKLKFSPDQGWTEGMKKLTQTLIGKRKLPLAKTQYSFGKN